MTFISQCLRFRYSFICRGTSTRRQEKGLFRSSESSCHLLLPV